MKENAKTNFSKSESPKMFDRIAKRYDRLNRVMTLGLDIGWRKAMSRLMPSSIDHWLDAATGTGDQILFSLSQGIKAKKITGIDLSCNMLSIGQKKLKNFENVYLEHGSITSIPFTNSSLDVITCSFGVRNVPSLQEALKEFYRALKPSGTLLILESSTPKNKILNFLHSTYMQKILPLIAVVLRTDPKAYQYLATTTSCFPCGENFLTEMKKAGFKMSAYKSMAFGSVTLYHAKK